MADHVSDERAPLEIGEVARAALELAAQRDLQALLSGFLDTVQRWAAPSAVMAAVRQAGAENGWRLLPALTSGSVPVGIERSLASLVERSPECLTRPTAIRPGEEVAGVRPRDNWIVPFCCEGDSGVLLLRGVPRPCPPNLGDALAVVSAPVWPRLLGSPAARVQALAAQIRDAAATLQAEADRQLQRLAAADHDAAVGAAREQVAELSQDQAELSERVARLSADLESSEIERLAGVERMLELRHAAEVSAGEAESLRAALAEAEARTCAAQQAVASAEQAAAEAAQAGAALAAERASERERADRAEARASAAEQALVAAQRESEEALAAARGESEEALAALRRDAEEAVAAARREAEEALSTSQRAADDALAAVQRSADEALATAQRNGLQALATVQRQAEETSAAAVAEAGAARAAAEAQVSELERALESARREADELRARCEHAESLARDVSAQADTTLAPLREVLAAARRSAFVPAGLRLRIDEVGAAMLPQATAADTPWMRLVILDRDLGGLEPLAASLEALGLEVRVANYPEEVGLLLRAPGAAELGAAVCDVMAFRPDQNVAGLFRAWDKDRPGLPLFLSYDAESAVELERAKRIPLSLLAGQVTRPIVSARLVELLHLLSRRQASRLQPPAGAPVER